MSQTNRAKIAFYYSMSGIIIREIKTEDNKAIAKVIREVLVEFDVPKTGTAYADKSLDEMYETYNTERAVYFIVEENGELIGGAGIAQLANYQGNVCELQKMYFSSKARGKGVGVKMMRMCLEKAGEFGFEYCYLETMPNMYAAHKLYEKSGFEYIDKPLGDTGHCSCPVWMLKKLK